MGVQDVPLPPVYSSKNAYNSPGTNVHAAYRQNGREDLTLSNGTRGSIPSGRVNASLMPQQASVASYQNFAANNTHAAPTRKRKAPDTSVAVVDLTGDSPPPSEAPKRKRPATPKGTSNRSRVTDGDRSDSYGSAVGGDGQRDCATRHTDPCTGKEEQPSSSAKRAKNRPSEHEVSKSVKSQASVDDRKTPKKKAKQDGEKRMRRWRNHPPSAYKEVRDRALTQRMFALDRLRSYDNPEHPSETISLAGTTGNVYTIIVDMVPSCDCPHAKKGNQCKHICYVLSRVLRAPADLEYQLAFTSSELKDIFANAPPLPSETASKDAKDGNRKPVEGECPICCEDFEPGSSENVVYCKAACGNNVHKDCFGQWAATKTGQAVTCPFCRAPWQGDEAQLKEVAKRGTKNAEGYVNVASQLGLSGRRDYSSYNSYWVRGRARRGEIAWDEDGVMDHEY